jgi:hypothetical protein
MTRPMIGRASAENLFRLDVGVAARGARGRDYRRATRTDLRGRLGQTGVDIGGRVNDPAGAVELMTEGFARTAAYALVRLVWHCLIRLGPRGYGRVFPPTEGDGYWSVPPAWAKADEGPASKMALITPARR